MSMIKNSAQHFRDIPSINRMLQKGQNQQQKIYM